MVYIAFFLGLFIIMLAYFRLANHFNIIDKPNHRSSHESITIRGGGVIFYVAALIYFVVSNFQYPYFFLGLTLMTLISFLDDILSLSNRLRIAIHLISVLFLSYQLNLFQLPWIVLIIGIVIMIGIINAYNFMDGINGITAMNSFAVLFLLWVSNINILFIDERLLYCVALGNLVFSIFNFRQNARCFAGDVGSVGMAFILIFILAMLIFSTGNFIYLLFLAIYGVDTFWTILRRLLRKENIFKAHRSHLYQYLANEAGVNKLKISLFYGTTQLVIGLLTIYVSNYSIKTQLIFSLGCITILSVGYLFMKRSLIVKHQL